jgi:hypothetical protein
MATATDTPTAPARNYIDPDHTQHDTLRRHLKRTLPVKLTRDEQTDIAIAASKKRLAVKQLEKDLDDEKKRRQAQINEIQRDVDVSDRELATGEQDRIVSCNEIFRDGMVHVVRTDTWEIFESRPATAQEAQRFLPAVEATLGTSAVKNGKAAVATAMKSPAAQPGTGEDEPDDSDDDEPEDDGLTEQTPAQRAAKESAAAREKRRNGKSGGKATP